MGTWECEAFLAAYYVYSYHLHRGLAGQECDLSYIYIPARQLCPVSLTYQKEDGGIVDSP